MLRISRKFVDGYAVRVLSRLSVAIGDANRAILSGVQEATMPLPISPASRRLIHTAVTLLLWRPVRPQRSRRPARRPTRCGTNRRSRTTCRT